MNKKKNIESKTAQNKLISTQFLEILTDKNNIKFKTTKTNNCFDDEYPLKTDVCCGWCRHNFETQHIGIPIKKHKKRLLDGRMFLFI